MYADAISQSDAFAATAVGAGDRARFFRAPRQDSLECLAATFRTHVYAPHTHDTFVVGIIEAGCETFHLRGTKHYAEAGMLCFVEPGEVHDGAPHDKGYAYRMSYPSADFLAAVAAELGERPVRGGISFRGPCVRDPELVARFGAAHRAAEAAASALETDEALHAVFSAALARHAVLPAAGTSPSLAAPREPGPVARAIAFLDGHYEDDVDLATLAGIAGIPRTRLIRAMRRETGLTPHAWLTDRRVRAARAFLTAGFAPAEVAARCGFYDQSHLNRAFKARTGVSPGAFRAGL
ncbi:AraC family transcriptional regulator [Segnochrobactrum spirostomi]|uniref:AraC family transcriptional regulator n=1 Tax=Segnochrobactrum spirostomi TaxID=2608987 RepID=A0A6A7XXW5_9HYPH|nr:AraC family transcriptional regulator [Segnochrobactrum spirostomi]MQT11534.1 AraC family transcriptional regulator [Segnochrobactrum spirostomi]